MAVLCSVEGLNCRKCEPRNNTAAELERVEALKASKGCKERAPSPQYGDSETGEYLYRCPVSLLTLEALEVLGVMDMIEMGFLPRSGGFYDQDARLMARVRCAFNIKAEMISKERE